MGNAVCHAVLVAIAQSANKWCFKCPDRMDKAFLIELTDGVESLFLGEKLQAERVVKGFHKLPVHCQAVAVSCVHVPCGHAPAHAGQPDGALHLFEYFFHVFHGHDLPKVILFLIMGQNGPGNRHEGRFINFIQALDAVRDARVKAIQKFCGIPAPVLLVQQLNGVIFHRQIPLLSFAVLRAEFTHLSLRVLFISIASPRRNSK